MKKKRDKNQSSLLQHDQSFLDQGFVSLAGVDEAGRGPLAGPVVASAVIVRDFSFAHVVDDSKNLTPKLRAVAYEEILEKSLVGIGVVDAAVIDKINIFQATFLAMEEAVMKLREMPDCILVDGPRTPQIPVRQYPIVNGDAKSFSIACASIVAKVTRDRIMDYYDRFYPEYGFAQHKGYGTPEHLEALEKNGPCAIHRKTFAPIKMMVTNG